MEVVIMMMTPTMMIIHDSGENQSINRDKDEYDEGNDDGKNDDDEC